MNKIAKNYILTLVYELIAIAVPLLTAPYLTRTLHAANYGIYSYVQSLGGMIVTFSLLGIYSYGNRQVAYVRDNPRQLSQVFWEIMVLRLLLGLAGTVGYFAIASHTRYRLAFALYYAYFLSNIIDCSWVYVGTENMFPCVVKNIVAKVLTLVGVFILVREEEQVGMYIAIVAFSSLVTNISVYSQLRGVIGRPEIAICNLFRHLKGSFVLFLPQIASLLYLQMGKVMMEGMTGKTDQVSFYDQAEKLVTVALSCITVLSTVMMPRIANEFKKNNQEAIVYYLNKASRYSMALAAPMMVGLLCAAPYLVPWYLGYDYMPTAYAIMIIAPIVIFNSLMGISGRQYFVATDQVLPLTVSNVIAAVLNLGINAALIPRLGYVGAAIATVVSSLFNAITQFAWMNRSIRVKNIMRGTIRYILFALIMGIATWIFTRALHLQATIATTFFQMVVAFACYGVLLWLTNDETFSLGMRIVRESTGKISQIFQKR